MPAGVESPLAGLERKEKPGKQFCLSSVRLERLRNGVLRALVKSKSLK